MEGPEAAGLVAVAGVDDHARVPGDHLGAAEGVVELVDGEEGAHAHPADLPQPGIDLGPAALGDVVHLAAAEEPRDLDPLDHRQLALVDHAPGLEGVGDDPEPALARPT